MRPLEDRLFEKYRRRQDARLLAKVFDRTAPALLRIARHTTGQPDLADDVLQQTFLVAIERADRWDSTRGVFPWLVGILVRQAKRIQRRERRAPLVERLSIGTNSESTTTVDLAEARELEQAIASAVKDLGDTYRPVLHLHLFHGLNAKQIGKALDRPAGSVRTQLVRGLAQLRRALPVGLAAVGAALAPALAAVRLAVLREAGAVSALAATGAKSAGISMLVFEGSMMKKWFAFAVALALVAFVVYPLLPAPDDGPEPPVSTSPPLASGELEPDEDAQAPVSGQRERVAAVSPERSALADTPLPAASLRVRVVAAVEPGKENPGGEPRGLPGIWVRLHTNQMPAYDARRFGARTDAAGEVLFENVPSGSWRATAAVGPEDARGSIRLAGGELRELQLISRMAHFVSVRVVDTARRPVIDAEVWSGLKVRGRVLPMQVNGRLAGRTDASGRARVAVGPGEFVSARKLGYVASLSSPANAGGDEAILLVLRDGVGAASVAGEVLYDDGKPIVGATVQVVRAAGSDQVGMALRGQDGIKATEPLDVLVVTDGQGHFEVHGLAPANYVIWTDAASRTHEGAAVSLREHERRHVRLLVPRRAFVTGVVTRQDGSPAAGVLIGARSPDQEGYAASGVINRDGTFTFEIAHGPVRIEVWRKHGTVLVGVDTMASATPKVLQLKIHDPLSVAGRLVDQDGVPVQDWVVGALPEGSELTGDAVHDAILSGRTARSGEDGRFALFGCGEGPFVVFARPVRDRVTGPAPVRRHEVRVGATGLELVVPDAALQRAALRLRVLDVAGIPIAAAEVRLFVGRQRHVLLPVHGVFAKDGLVHGRYYLEVRAPNYASEALRVRVDAAETELADVVLQPSAQLEVRPLLDGQPWRGPLPRPVVHDGATDKRVEPQPVGAVHDGVLQLEGLPAGRFVLRPSSADDLVAKAVAVRLLPGPAARVDWPLRVGRKLTLRFAARAKAAAGDRLSVTVRKLKGGVVLQRELSLVAGQGCFLLEHEFVPGSYVVQAGGAKQSAIGMTTRWPLVTSQWPNGGVVDVPFDR